VDVDDAVSDVEGDAAGVVDVGSVTPDDDGLA
jgi:hypothetical protein